MSNHFYCHLRSERLIYDAEHDLVAKFLIVLYYVELMVVMMVSLTVYCLCAFRQLQLELTVEDSFCCSPGVL